MAELVDAPGSGPGEAIHRSSSLLSGRYIERVSSGKLFFYSIKNI